MGRVAVILSGCGCLDGSEIHESVLCLLHLASQGHFYRCFAPDIMQKKVVNHLTKEEMKTDHRNVLIESARIARGKIDDIGALNPDDFDALLLPGGFGVALNLSNFAEDDKNFSVLESLKNIIVHFHKNRKPIGATCISPIILAKLFEDKIKLNMTLGTDKNSLKILSDLKMNAKSAKVDEIVIDRENKIYTTPCYMLPEDLKGLSEGIEKLIKEFL